jgi:hypothetical protein
MRKTKLRQQNFKNTRFQLLDYLENYETELSSEDVEEDEREYKQKNLKTGNGSPIES